MGAKRRFPVKVSLFYVWYVNGMLWKRLDGDDFPTDFPPEARSAASIISDAVPVSNNGVKHSVCVDVP